MRAKSVSVLLTRYPGYTFCVASVLLHAWDQLVYAKHWAVLCENAKSGAVTSWVCSAVMVDKAVIITFFIAAMTALLSITWWTKCRISSRDAKVSRLVLIFSSTITGTSALGILIFGLMTIIKVHSMALGDNPLIPARYIPWHRLYEIASLFVLIISSALSIEDAPFDSKNKSFSALLYVALATALSFSRFALLYYYCCGVALCLSAWSLQGQISSVFTSDLESNAKPQNEAQPPIAADRN